MLDIVGTEYQKEDFSLNDNIFSKYYPIAVPDNYVFDNAFICNYLIPENADFSNHNIRKKVNGTYNDFTIYKATPNYKKYISEIFISYKGKNFDTDIRRENVHIHLKLVSEDQKNNSINQLDHKNKIDLPMYEYASLEKKDDNGLVFRGYIKSDTSIKNCYDISNIKNINKLNFVNSEFNYIEVYILSRDLSEDMVLKIAELKK